MDAIASQITSLTIVYSIVCSDADQRKLQSSASLAFVQGIHRGPVNSPHKWPVTRKMFPFDDVIMYHGLHTSFYQALRNEQNGQHFADDIFICISMKQIVFRLIISQCFFRWWLGTQLATSHYMNQCSPSFMTPHIHEDTTSAKCLKPRNRVRTPPLLTWFNCDYDMGN